VSDSPLLALRAVGLAYGSRRVLEDVNLEVGAGERLAVVGPNGAGKSSLLRCITGVARGRVGDIAYDGVPLEALGREQIARRIAVVPQQAVLPFAVRVEELVGLGRIPYEDPLRGPGAADHLAVEAAIERVGLGPFVGRDVRELSLGERQLVLVALALAQSARLLVLDEPTVHLDLRHRVQVLELLAELSERDGVTILAVLHDLALAARFFPRLVLLDAGRLVADGPPSDALAPARIRGVFGVDPAIVPLAV
jgi:iron complex transport system ATP-binding protein